ncbi:uncharacterized protein LOC115444633 isoform X1 [Manduca sexta]|uniref:uncharacterized protein LOC115444633 isoform X1 n=1 Tax=Manduca sexta TaxID=7130 RepID=UPI00188F4814|nr:uncharacterized protein LOC115444633 isoform X1 [Manduca sexta]
MYRAVFILFIVFSNAESVRDCSYVSCIADFFQTFFSSDTVSNTQNIKEIKVGELKTIFSDITDLIKNQKNKTDEVLKDYGKTQVFVKYVTFDDDHHDFKGAITDIEEDNKSDDDSDLIGESKEIELNNDLNTNSTEQTTIKNEEATHKTESKVSTVIDLNFVNFEKSLGDLRTNEIYEDLDVIYYDDNSTDYPIIDYIEIYKDTTNEENLYVPTEPAISNEIDKPNEFVEVKDFTNETIAAITKSNMEEENLAIVVSWIATIFLKNDQNTGQFDYYCDGALLSNKAVLTGARCVNVNNSTVNPEDLLVVVGKKALSGTGPKEKTYRIIKVIPHENFTIENPVANDLAILMLEEPVVFNVDVRPANISLEMDFDANVEKSATTAWAYNGVLGFLFFEKVQNKTCRNTDFVENTICGTYGLGVPLCPSYGGLFVAKLKDHWNLQGIMYGDPAERGLCFSKDVTYTSLKNYLEWIDVNVNKNII